MKIGLIQMDVVDDKARNLEVAEKFIRLAATQEAEVVLLPEMFNTPYGNEFFIPYAEEGEGPTLSLLKRLAKELGILLVGGSIPEADQGKIYNTSYIVDDKGEVLDKHRKAHLFDIDVKGGITFFESKTLTPGDKVTILETSIGRIGVAICYDIRFPEVFRKMALEGVSYVFIPAAFNHITGPAHWEILTRARALDNQMYLFIASPATSSVLDYKAYGHTLGVDPWGRILGELGNREGLLVLDVDPSEVRRIKEELPTMKHRRPELYD
ncbi:MAG: carbon-nitrogen hydrolase [delta proteobacterium ML8_F1]|nr:MAG: carbon-nitrogen hydrolase [delta proteobacterium ML8_F1]